MSVPRSLRGLFVVGLIAVLLGWPLLDWPVPGPLGSPPAAEAQQGPDADGDVRLELTAIDGVRGPGSGPDATAATSPDVLERSMRNREVSLRLLVENRDEVAVDALRVVVEFHPAVATRGLLEEAFDGRLLSEAAVVHGVDVDGGAALPPDDIVGLDIDLPAELPFAEGDGVHPLRITLMRGTVMLDEVTTAIIWLGQRPAEPVELALIWPFDAPPWRGPGGTYPQGADREIQPGGRLDRLLVAAEGASTSLLSLAPSAHLLEDLTDRAGGFRRTVRTDSGVLEEEQVAADQAEALLASRTLRRLRALTSDQRVAPLTGTYADVDLTALLDHGDEAARLAGSAASEARRRLPGQLGRDIDPAVHLAAGDLAPAVLDIIGGDTVVLTAAAAGLPDIRTDSGFDPDIGEVVRPLVAPSGRQLSAVIADPYLEAAFAADPPAGGSVVAAQNLLARTAMFHTMAPDVADRALVLRPPSTWAPSTTTAQTLLTMLEQASWLEARSVTELAAGARRGAEPIDLGDLGAPQEPAPLPDAGDAPATLDRELVTDLEQASTGIDALVSALPDPTNRVEGRSIDQLRDDVLRAGSRWLIDSGDGEALIRDVQRAINTRRGDVEVTTGTVTLTSDTGQIPVTLQRSRGEPIRVVVTVESQGRLLWPEGRRSEELLLETEGASQTVSFETRALSTGTFPVTVRVTDPDGLVTMTETTVSVRSTAISRPALIATGALVAILLLWGATRRRGGSSPRRGPGSDDEPSLQAIPTEEPPHPTRVR